MTKDTPTTPTLSLTVKQATDAIVEMINGQPRSPRPEEIASVVSRVTCRPPDSRGGASELGLAIRAAIAEINAVNEWFITIDDERSPQWHECQRKLLTAEARLAQLATGLPLVPRSFSDLLTIAEVAYHHHEKEVNGSLAGLDPAHPCPNEYWTPRLILAVVTMGGRSYA